MNAEQKKILVAMSGGVDSAVTALLLAKEGANCVGGCMLLRKKCDLTATACGSDLDAEDAAQIAEKLGFDVEKPLEDVEIPSRGYRQLTKIPKMPMGIIDNMNKAFGDFQHIIRASIEELDDVDGIGEIRAKNIKQGIKRMHEQVIYDSKFYR